MSIVTAVNPQKKKTSRFNVFLDGKFAFGVSAENLLKHNIKVGNNITLQKVRTIIKDEELGSLINLSLGFLSFRPRSQWEIESYLAKKIATKEDIKISQSKDSPLIVETINKLEKYKYINDREFAKWWLDSRLRSSTKGPKYIRSELIKKNIDRKIIEEVINSFPAEKHIALRALKKKLPSWQKLSMPQFKKKVFSYLLQRGYNTEVIYEIIAFLVKKR